MNGNGIVSSLDLMFQWITRLFVLNLLWLTFSIVGFVVLGIFPSTVAALSVAKKWTNGERDISSWKTFKHYYKNEFLASNKIGMFLALIGGLLYLNYNLIANAKGEVFMGTIFAFYLIVFFYFIIVIWFFPLLVQYQNSFIQQLKNAMIIGIAKIHYTVAIALVFFYVTYLSLQFPSLILFFSISVLLVAWVWLTGLVFRKIDEK
ncbi:Uncharacterized membrane protein YesL [Virgibacillus subterraneus]|uniref:Uncharacterized membrane protein YesL n=1 Tax=Virgibacillus subterraneus TaxID=621109 RepID=A0A1H9B1I2_9BACI|nr:YesL family protein [Virgibacillus subterraneus]SEP82571.1 Uncharacterized membrane protein YesL [Virgibacillus subterraneus]